MGDQLFGTTLAKVENAQLTLALPDGGETVLNIDQDYTIKPANE